MQVTKDSEILKAIRIFLVSEGFEVGGDDGFSPVFTKKFHVPGRVMYVNGEKLEEAPREVVFPIKSLGEGRIFTNTEDDGDELQGFKIGNTDIWVDSLEDFRFWYSKVFER